jgi:hypothetical protein
MRWKDSCEGAEMKSARIAAAPAAVASEIRSTLIGSEIFEKTR